MIYNIFFIILLLAAILCAWKISVTDWQRRIIPDIYLFPLLLIGLIIVQFFPWPINMADSILAAVFGYILSAVTGFLFNVSRTKKSANTIAPIGMGDIKLLATGGIWLGTTGLASALIIACITGMVWGIRKKQKFIPFAPFFVLGGFLTLIVIRFLI